MKRRAPISPAAYATLTRPLISKEGRFDRAAICRKARREYRDGHARTWSEAMAFAWLLARRQLEKALEYDADCRAFKRAPIVCRQPSQTFPQYAAAAQETRP